MAAVLAGFFTIWAVIALGWFCAHIKLFDVEVQRSLAKVAFFVGLPALLFNSLRTAELARIFSTNVIVSVLAIFATMGLYLLISARWQRNLSQRVIGSFASCYVNANNMGLPIAAYVIGDTSWVAPILLIQIIFLQPVGLAILEAQLAKKEGKPSSLLKNVTLPLRNPMTIGVLLGLAVNVLNIGLPKLLTDTVGLVGQLSVPAMLIAFGISLRLGPLPGKGNLAETGLVSVLKVVGQPLIAFVLAKYLFGLDLTAALAVTVMAGLPTAQNVFVFAMRGKEAVQLARDVIFISSFASIPAITLLSTLVHLS